jgi:hypothetical protein
MSQSIPPPWNSYMLIYNRHAYFFNKWENLKNASFKDWKMTHADSRYGILLGGHCQVNLPWYERRSGTASDL